MHIAKRCKPDGKPSNGIIVIATFSWYSHWVLLFFSFHSWFGKTRSLDRMELGQVIQLTEDENQKSNTVIYF